MASAQSSYAAYVQLSSILSSQLPRSSRDDLETWSAERYFIVCHQVSEILASQILTDVKSCAQLISTPAQRCAAQRLLVRAAASSMQFYQQSEQLIYSCPRDSFLAFRPLLENVSASQSEQFAELLKISTREHPDQMTIESAMNNYLGACPANPMATSSARSEALNILEALHVTASAITLWRQLHILMAAFFIGGMPGTGGTTGVEYLTRRMEEGAWKYARLNPESTTKPQAPPALTIGSMKSRAAALAERVQRLQASLDAALESVFRTS